MFKISLPIFTAILLSSCASHHSSDQLTGAWVQPIPGQAGKEQGIQFDADGKASSININTLVYDSWTKEGNTITLKGKSIGNKHTFNFADKAQIKELTANKLVLLVDGQRMTYTRKK